MTQETTKAEIKTEYYYYDEKGKRVTDKTKAIRFWARKYRTDTDEMILEWHGVVTPDMKEK